MQSSYLESYIEQWNSLPNVTNQNLKQIKDLDMNCSQVHQKLQLLENNYLNSLKTSHGSHKNQLQRQAEVDITKSDIDQLHQQCIMISEQQMNIAEQLYQLLDEACNDLDEELKKYHQDIYDGDNHNLNNRIQPTHRDRVGEDRQDGQRWDKVSQRYIKQSQYNEQMAAGNQKFDETIEPRYCYCNQPSYGEMIKCDKPLCIKEWFHLSCAKLNSIPQGQWYCINCSKKKGSKF